LNNKYILFCVIFLLSYGKHIFLHDTITHKYAHSPFKIVLPRGREHMNRAWNIIFQKKFRICYTYLKTVLSNIYFLPVTFLLLAQFYPWKEIRARDYTNLRQLLWNYLKKDTKPETKVPSWHLLLLGCP